MAIKHCQLNLLDGALVDRRRARVIDHPILGAIGRDVRRPEYDHHVIGILLNPGLIEEKQIAGLGLAPVAVLTQQQNLSIQTTMGSRTRQSCARSRIATTFADGSPQSLKSSSIS